MSYLVQLIRFEVQIAIQDDTSYDDLFFISYDDHGALVKDAITNWMIASFEAQTANGLLTKAAADGDRQGQQQQLVKNNNNNNNTSSSFDSIDLKVVDKISLNEGHEEQHWMIASFEAQTTIGLLTAAAATDGGGLGHQQQLLNNNNDNDNNTSSSFDSIELKVVDEISLIEGYEEQPHIIQVSFEGVSLWERQHDTVTPHMEPETVKLIQLATFLEEDRKQPKEALQTTANNFVYDLGIINDDVDNNNVTIVDVRFYITTPGRPAAVQFLPGIVKRHLTNTTWDAFVETMCIIAFILVAMVVCLIRCCYNTHESSARLPSSINTNTKERRSASSLRYPIGPNRAPR